MEPITRTLVHFCHELDSKHLSAEVVDRTKYLLLDYLGVAIAGSLSESSQPIYKMLARTTAQGPCTVIGTPTRTSADTPRLPTGQRLTAWSSMTRIRPAPSIPVSSCFPRP